MKRILVVCFVLLNVLLLGVIFRIGAEERNFPLIRREGVYYMDIDSIRSVLSILSDKLKTEDFEMGKFGPMYFLRFKGTVVSFMEGKSMLSGPDFVRYLSGPIYARNGLLYVPVFDLFDTLQIPYRWHDGKVLLITCTLKKIAVLPDGLEIVYDGEDIFDVRVVGKSVSIKLKAPCMLEKGVYVPSNVKVKMDEEISVEVPSPVKEYNVERARGLLRIHLEFKKLTYRYVVFRVDGRIAKDGKLRKMFKLYGLEPVESVVDPEQTIVVDFHTSSIKTIVYEPEPVELKGISHKNVVISKRIAALMSEKLGYTYEPLFLSSLDQSTVSLAIFAPLEDLEKIVEAMGKCVLEL